MKIQKFLNDYGYTAVKLIVTHIAMSIFGLMLYLPTGGSPMLGGIFGNREKKVNESETV